VQTVPGAGAVEVPAGHGVQEDAPRAGVDVAAVVMDPAAQTEQEVVAALPLN
jgi:hypothetical protein